MEQSRGSRTRSQATARGTVPTLSPALQQPSRDAPTEPARSHAAPEGQESPSPPHLSPQSRTSSCPSSPQPPVLLRGTRHGDNQGQHRSRAAKASPRSLAHWHPAWAAPSACTARDPAPRGRTPYSPLPPAAAHGAWGRGGDSQGRAEHAAQPSLPGEASARLTYFSFRITCFHFPSPRLGPPARPQPRQVTPAAPQGHGAPGPAAPHGTGVHVAGSAAPGARSAAGPWAR